MKQHRQESWLSNLTLRGFNFNPGKVRETKLGKSFVCVWECVRLLLLVVNFYQCKWISVCVRACVRVCYFGPMTYLSGTVFVLLSLWESKQTNEYSWCLSYRILMYHAALSRNYSASAVCVCVCLRTYSSHVGQHICTFSLCFLSARAFDFLSINRSALWSKT